MGTKTFQNNNIQLEKTTNKRKAMYCHYEKILSYTNLGLK